MGKRFYSGENISKNNIDVYVDDHLLLVQYPPAIRTAIRDHAIHTIDSVSNDVNGVICRLPRPANVCHIGVDALIPMSDLSPAFTDALLTYAMPYFLLLP